MSGRRSRLTRLAEWLGIERQPGGVTLVRARAVVLLLGLMLLLVAGLVALGDAYTDDVIRASLGFALVAILLGVLAQAGNSRPRAPRCDTVGGDPPDTSWGTTAHGR